ncbi:MAG: glycosyltransferase family 4 protein [Candidatus Poseidoniaceae archaeon]|nr:glycosyltransferase family 4 protein [Candidatus Poseidoniaceae archaeon]
MGLTYPFDFIMTPVEAVTKPIAGGHCGIDMRRVLHVGPVNTPGGMGKVIQILYSAPPEGWEAETLDSHSTMGVIAKIIAMRRARKFIRQNGHSFDIIHFHSAADWSWFRKIHLLKQARKTNAKIVFHIHSGRFDSWARKHGERYGYNYWKKMEGVNVVTLSESWTEKLRKYIGESTPMINPVDPLIEASTKERSTTQFLIMGRPDPVKGHIGAIALVQKLRNDGGNFTLTATGIKAASENWVDAKGWVSEEEKRELLHTSKALLVPSSYEGQPLIILEALASGCPVIASSAVPDLPSCVSSIPLDDIEGWTEAMVNPISEGLVEAAKKHNIENVRKNWGRFYDEIMDSKASTE